jgi:hypothetical protein
MKKKYIIIMLICSVLFIFYLWGAIGGYTISKKLGKTNYYLIENVANVVGLYYEYPDDELTVGVLRASVTNVYWDEQYILVTSCNTQNDNIEVYYIIKMLPPVEKGVPWEKIGPLSKEEYEQKKQELHLREKDMQHINILD